MVETRQTVTRREENGIDATGASVQQETKQFQTETAADPKTTFQNLVWFILGLIEVLLALRFIFKLLGANTASSFVNLIYNVTDILTAPFDSIFGVASATDGEIESVFEPSIIVAAIVYALIAWGIVKLININQRR